MLERLTFITNGRIKKAELLDLEEPLLQRAGELWSLLFAQPDGWDKL